MIVARDYLGLNAEERVIAPLNREMIGTLCMLSFKWEVADLPLMVPSGSVSRCTFNHFKDLSIRSINNLGMKSAS